MAKLAGVQLSKAALSHVQVPRTRYDSPLLPDAAVQVGPNDVSAIPCWMSMLPQNMTQDDVRSQHETSVMQALPHIPDDFHMAVDGDQDSHQQQQTQPDASSSDTGPASAGQHSDSQQQTDTGGSQQGQQNAADRGTEPDGGPAEVAEGSNSANKTAIDDDVAAEDGSAAARTASKEPQQATSSSGSSSSGGGALQTEADEDSPAGDTSAAPRLNATEAARIDFDDVDADATHGSGFLARLSDSVSGALGGVFS
jgi:hypothetical protein